MDELEYFQLKGIGGPIQRSLSHKRKLFPAQGRPKAGELRAGQFSATVSLVEKQVSSPFPRCPQWANSVLRAASLMITVWLPQFQASHPDVTPHSRGDHLFLVTFLLLFPLVTSF